MIGAASEFDLAHLVGVVRGLLQNQVKYFVNHIYIYIGRTSRLAGS